MQVKRLLLTGAILVLMLVMFASGWLVATTGFGRRVDPAALTDLERQFTERMRDSTMSGFFTIAGREDRPARPDRYDISSVEKVGDDRWRFNARIRYGETDVTLPITVTMRWLDDTPMIMLTDATIPSLGTFGVRLLFNGDRYAGTWQHEQVGGHMFGRIAKQGSGTGS